MRASPGINMSRKSVPHTATLQMFLSLLQENDLAKTLYDQERQGLARPGYVPGQEGREVVRRDEGAHRRGCPVRAGAHGHQYGGQRQRRDQAEAPTHGPKWSVRSDACYRGADESLEA